jgi:hypothetical protein
MQMLALDKDYRLGFQASSDHISTHVSYACILAEEFSRKRLIKSMRRRHSYAATDNIVLDVRLGNHLMGDEVESGSRGVVAARRPTREKCPRCNRARFAPQCIARGFQFERCVPFSTPSD